MGNRWKQHETKRSINRLIVSNGEDNQQQKWKSQKQ